MKRKNSASSSNAAPVRPGVCVGGLGGHVRDPSHVHKKREVQLWRHNGSRCVPLSAEFGIGSEEPCRVQQDAGPPQLCFVPRRRPTHNPVSPGRSFRASLRRPNVRASLFVPWGVKTSTSRKPVGGTVSQRTTRISEGSSEGAFTVFCGDASARHVPLTCRVSAQTGGGAAVPSLFPTAALSKQARATKISPSRLKY